MYKKKFAKPDEVHIGDDVGIKDVIERLLEVYKLKRRFDETAIIEAWPKLIGVAIANRTKQLFINEFRIGRIL